MCLPWSSKGCWMDDKGCRKTPSLWVQTAPFGRCWYQQKSADHKRFLKSISLPLGDTGRPRDVVHHEILTWKLLTCLMCVCFFQNGGELAWLAWAEFSSSFLNGKMTRMHLGQQVNQIHIWKHSDKEICKYLQIEGRGRCMYIYDRVPHWISQMYQFKHSKWCKQQGVKILPKHQQVK